MYAKQIAIDRAIEKERDYQNMSRYREELALWQIRQEAAVNAAAELAVASNAAKAKTTAAADKAAADKAAKTTAAKTTAAADKAAADKAAADKAAKKKAAKALVKERKKAVKYANQAAAAFAEPTRPAETPRLNNFRRGQPPPILDDIRESSLPLLIKLTEE